MNNSMISAMVSLNTLQQRLDVIADNLANQNTVGYKKKEASFEDVLTQVQRHHQDFSRPGRATPPGFTLGYGMKLSSITQSMEQGQLLETGYPLDLAIQGNAMFVVRSGGELRYTRDGSFNLVPDPTADGNLLLVDAKGNPVLNTANATISIPDNGKVAVDEEGRILVETAAGRTEAGQLRLVELQRQDGLVPMEDNLYMIGNGLAEGDVFDLAPPADGMRRSTVSSGFLEQSNVNMADEMTRMMEVQRAYQLTARALSSSDTMMNLANTMRG